MVPTRLFTFDPKGYDLWKLSMRLESSIHTWHKGRTLELKTIKSLSGMSSRVFGLALSLVHEEA